MSTIIMSQCWPLQGLSAPQKAVLISLADNANDEGVCWPSVARIAERTCLSERAVRTSLRKLEELGILVSHQRSGRSTWYTVNPDDYNPGTTCPPEQDAPRHQMPPTPAPDAGHPGTTCPQNRKGTVIEPSDMSPPAAATPGDDQKSKRIPYEKIRELYNEILGDHLPRCLGLTDNHRKRIRSSYNLCLEGVYVVRENGLDFWSGLFHDVLHCKFLLGTNGRNWMADFEFLITATKIQRFMEGKYDER